MKTKRRPSRPSTMPPGKEKAPIPSPTPPAAAPASESANEPEKPEIEEPVLAPDGTPEPKKEPIPLF